MTALPVGRAQMRREQHIDPVVTNGSVKRNESDLLQYALDGHGYIFHGK